MQKLSLTECVRAGWQSFKKRPWVFIGVLIIYILTSMLSSNIASWTMEYGGAPVGIALSVLDMLVVQVLLSMGLIAFSLRFYADAASVTFGDLWVPRMYLSFLAMSVLSMIIVILGLFALIIPGIILAIAFMFAQYIVIDKETGPIVSLKESWRITKGNRWRLFFLSLLLIVINIVGLLALVVGLFITVPVSMLAMVHAYRMLGRGTVQNVPAATPAPAMV